MKKIPSVIALICILVYVTVVMLAAYRIYLGIEDQRGAAVRELDTLAALLSRNSFTDEQGRNAVRAKLVESRVLEGIIITGSGGKELAFEKEQGQAVRWSADSPCFIRRFGTVSLPAKPVDVTGMRNVNIYSVYNAINYPYVTGILKRALIVILAALLVAFLTLISISTARGAGRIRGESGVAVKFEERLRHKKEKKKKDKQNQETVEALPSENSNEDLFLDDEKELPEETGSWTESGPAPFHDEQGETEDFDFATFDDSEKNQTSASDDAFSFDDFDGSEKTDKSTVNNAASDVEDLPDFDGSVSTGEDDLADFGKEDLHGFDDSDDTDLPDFDKEDTADEDILPDFDKEDTAARKPAEADDFALDDFFNEEEFSGVELPTDETEPDTAGTPAANKNDGGPRGLFSPESSIGWEEYTRDRLSDELHRCASTEQDMVVMLIECGENVPCTPEFYKNLAAETVQFFNMRDLTFEKGKRGISVIIPGIDLDQGIAKAGEFHSRVLKKLAESFSAKTDLRIGLSSRSGRLIDADRFLFESAGALEKAKKGEPVVAFRSDPEKYREFIRRTGRTD
jgi:hypothetical protein